MNLRQTCDTACDRLVTSGGSGDAEKAPLPSPKSKTLELFGTRQADGKFAPFHLYSMRQAIEEGFILDVLANYTTYAAYWRLLKKVEGDPRYDKRKAELLLKSFVGLHTHAIAEKVRVLAFRDP